MTKRAKRRRLVVTLVEDVIVIAACYAGIWLLCGLLTLVMRAFGAA